MHLSSITFRITTLFVLATFAAAEFGHGDGPGIKPTHALYARSDPRPDGPLPHPTKPHPAGTKLHQRGLFSHTTKHVAGDMPSGALLRRAQPNPHNPLTTSDDIVELETESDSILASVESAKRGFEAYQKTGGLHRPEREKAVLKLFDNLISVFHQQRDLLQQLAQSSGHGTASKKGFFRSKTPQEREDSGHLRGMKWNLRSIDTRLVIAETNVLFYRRKYLEIGHLEALTPLNEKIQADFKQLRNMIKQIQPGDRDDLKQMRAKVKQVKKTLPENLPV